MEYLGKNRLMHRKNHIHYARAPTGRGRHHRTPPDRVGRRPVERNRVLDTFVPRYHDHAPRPDPRKHQHRRAVGHGLGRYRNPERAADEIPNGKRRRSESPTGGGVPQTGSRAGGTTSPSASYPTGRSQQERGTNRHHSTSVQDRTGRNRICYAVQRIPIRVRRQPAIRLGLFRIRPIRVRAIRCQSPPPVRQSDERRFARGIIGGSPTG